MVESKMPYPLESLEDHLPAFIAQTLPTEEFIKFFKIVLEGETLWNSFTLDWFIEANRKLKMSPLGQLLQLPLPPPLPQGTSARALASWRKTFSKPRAEACEANKTFLMSTIDKKEYSRTLLVDDSSAEGARSAERHGGRSPRRNNLLVAALLVLSLRSSPPPRLMGPPPPVVTSPPPQLSGEKTNRGVTPRQEDAESRDAPLKSKIVLVPQTKSLSAMETEGNVFWCFKTRKDAILPTFDRWRPAIRERFLLHVYHSSRANSELNDMVEHYDGSKQKLEDQVNHLSSKLMKSNCELQDKYSRHEKLQKELSVAQGRLSESESAAYALNNQFTELEAKYKAIVKLRDAKLAKSASKAIKEVKCRGTELIQGAILFIQTEKTRSELESDIKDHESNLLLLDQTHEEDFSEEQESSSGSVDIAATEVSTIPIGIAQPDHVLPEAPLVVNNETVIIPDDECDVGHEPDAPSEQVPTTEPNETEPTDVKLEMVMDP
ncbi:hypothetical protein AXX17_AT5G29700 [Arabidopsis thaliana]|uniref:Uncharacterized protein n=1 Tax=Arabidopsis thaliana TaxID=3702 RepID=A0A178US43_ARATH|nr:hypothetical protein AXX17_AT5G29700 [Arabidopsis thaliana]